MTIEQVREQHEKRPFAGFVIHLADGRAFSISHPGYLGFSKSGRTIFIAKDNDAHEIIDLLLVTSLELPASPSSNGQAS
jgi:hypothetical protein